MPIEPQLPWVPSGFCDARFDESHQILQRHQLVHIILDDLQIVLLLDFHDRARVIERIEPDLEQGFVLVAQVRLARSARHANDLDDLVATTEMLRGRAEGKGLNFALHISPDVPRELHGDADRLRQVLINLLGNAIKFTSAGEVGLDVGLGALPGDGPQALRFKISDTGPGIPAKKLALIFESFTQADSSITDRYGGTGLGLTISRSLVELMGGRLEVSSEEGKGSVFTFVIGFARADNPTPRLAYPAIPSAPSPDNALLSLQKTGTGCILRNEQPQ